MPDMLSRSDSQHTRFEPDRMPLRWFVIAMACLVVAVAMMVFAMRVIERIGAREGAAIPSSPSAVTSPQVMIGPALEPSRAQNVTPEQDLASLRGEEDRVFAAMGWQSDSTGRSVRIPDDVVVRVATDTAHARTSPTTKQSTGASK